VCDRENDADGDQKNGDYHWSSTHDVLSDDELAATTS
jgi:hypothetical protein